MSELHSLLYGLYIQNYLQFSCIALVAYEYVITIHREVDIIWTRHVTGASILFLLNRYLMIMYSVVSPLPKGYVQVVISEDPPLILSLTLTFSCIAVLRLSEAIDIAQQVVFALFSALRVYALWNRNLVLFSLIMMLLLIPVATGIYYFTTASAVYLGAPFFTCGVMTSLSQDEVQRVTRATRIPVIVADALVLVLTWLKTFSHKREARRLSMQVPLSTLLLRDGTVYFFVLLVMNISQMVLTSKECYMDPFLNMLTPILVSRFMINLRQVDQTNEYSSQPTWSRFSAVNFHFPQSVLGNLGESLDHELDESTASTDNIEIPDSHMPDSPAGTLP